jgi:hypothetical protein
MTAASKTQTLQEKLVEVALAIRNIEKGGYNEAQKYSFVSEADVVRKVWPELLSRGILFYPVLRRVVSITEYKTARGGDSFLTTVESMWVATDGTDRIEVASLGQGTDTGGDKGVYKALTGDKKYAVLQLLGIATGDDPEITRADERDGGDTQQAGGGLTNEQKESLMTAAKEAGLEPDAFGQFIFDWTGKRSLGALTEDDLAKILSNVKQLAAFKVVAGE